MRSESESNIKIKRGSKKDRKRNVYKKNDPNKRVETKKSVNDEKKEIKLGNEKCKLRLYKR